MPAWLEPIATLFVALETFFLLAWFLARDQLSPSLKRVGWGGFILVLLSVGWSFWVETLLPALREGETRKVALIFFGFVLSVVGVGIVIYGGVRTLRGIFAIWGEQPDFSPQAIPNAAERWRAVAAYLLDLLLVPGLGLTLFGVGLIAGPGNYLSDPDILMEPRQWIASFSMMGLGLLQMLASALHSR